MAAVARARFSAAVSRSTSGAVGPARVLGGGGETRPGPARCPQRCGLAAPGWQPQFQDHMYLAYTNVVASSLIDTLPHTHSVKGLMAIQSMISLAVLVVVISRVINIRPS
jgi:hypothetical protein